MFDVEQRRRISAEELRDHLIGGQHFEARTEETGRDCTFEVLRTLMGDPLASTGGAANALGSLSRLGGALGSVGDLLDVARRSESPAERLGDREERPARSRNRRSRPDWAAETEDAPEGTGA
jgi:hypothetical protein